MDGYGFRGYPGGGYIVTLIPLQTWVTNGAGYLTRPGLTARAIAGRGALVYGTYEPTTPTAGLITPEGSLTALNSPSATTYTLTAGESITGKIIYGKLLPPASGDAEIHDSLILGSPNALTSGNDGAVTMTGAHTGIVRIYDSEIRPQVESPGRNCVLGGNYELHRVYLHGGEDGAGVYPASGNGTAAHVKIKGCLFGEMTYAYPDRDHTDGSHSDAIQIQGGTDIEIVGNSILGTCRYQSGSSYYYPTHTTSSGGDWSVAEHGLLSGSGIIIQDNFSAPFDSTVVIDSNYFHGCKAQLLIKSTANNFVCTNNKFSAVDAPAAHVSGTVVGGYSLVFTYNSYWIRFDAIGTSNNISGLVASGALANTTNVWLDGGSSGAALTTPRASGVVSDA